MLSRATDFHERPHVVIWEPTRACDLACLHCRTSPQPKRSNFELSTYEGYKLIDQVADLDPAVFVFSGGDPLKRSDLFEFISYANRRGLNPSLTPSATPLLTRDAISRMVDAGLSRIGLTVDGSSAAIHDGYRGIPGSFDLTFEAIRWARQAALPVQVNTTISRSTLGDLERIADLLEALEISTWSLFFPVPGGRIRPADLVSSWEAEEIFGRLYQIGRRVRFEVRTAEALHYRRFVLQQLMAETNLDLHQLLQRDALEHNLAGALAIAAGRTATGVGEGRGFLFITHTGEVQPSGFLPLPAGNVRHKRVADIYRNSPLFLSLRDSSMLKGKCGICEFRDVCGGSRARAWAASHDPLGEEPLCAYLPSGLQTRPHPELQPA